MSAPQWPASVELEKKVDLVMPSLTSVLQSFWQHPDVVELIPSLLFRMYCEARPTVDLLTTAAEHLESMDRDPTAELLVPYFSRMAREEAGHDGWLLDGLEAVGLDRAEVSASIPAASVTAMVGSQYYWILHHHPVAFMGFIKVVEMDPASLEEVDAMVARTGLPEETFRYHRLHAHLEPRHNDLFDETLDALPLDPRQRSAIGVNAIATLHHLAKVIQEILKLHQSRGSKAEEPLDAEQVMKRLQREGAGALL